MLQMKQIYLYVLTYIVIIGAYVFRSTRDIDVNEYKVYWING